MTTLIIITLFAAGIVYTISTVRNKIASNEEGVIGMLSVLGLIWTIVSFITFYKIIL
jgi:hypothetical protein